MILYINSLAICVCVVVATFYELYTIGKPLYIVNVKIKELYKVSICAPAQGAVVGELLEAGEAADQAAGAPGAAEEAEDRPHPTLGLDLVLHPRHHLQPAIRPLL